MMRAVQKIINHEKIFLAKTKLRKNFRNIKSDFVRFNVKEHKSIKVKGMSLGNYSERFYCLWDMC